MSRLAKKPIPIPEKTEASLSGNTLTVKGPAGTLSRTFPSSVALAIEERAVRVSPESSADAGAHLGTSAAHIQNMLRGSQEPFTKKLIVEGIGYKAEVKPARPDARPHDAVGYDHGRSGVGKEIVFALGFSHPVKVLIPENLKVIAEKNIVTICGADIERVGQFAARLRALKEPEPYKGKGIRYEGEVIRRKQGKKTV